MLNKLQDSAAASIRFGIETETMIPRSANIGVGAYHHGLPVMVGRSAATGEIINAPSFEGAYWRTERDSSIQAEPGYQACEFVSPILHGEAGIVALRQFIKFANQVGAKVNASTGCHITIGVASVIGTNDPEAMAKFARDLCYFAFKHAKALYGQTGTGRHLNRYSLTLPTETPIHLRKMMHGTEAEKIESANAIGRGMVNLKKLFTHGVVEFRLFAGTLNEAKLMHHLACVFALCRRVVLLNSVAAFRKTQAEVKGTETAPKAVKYFWEFAGWRGSLGRPCALGLFGDLFTEFKRYRKVAIQMAEKFEQKFPNSNL
jgi:Putative amidoligase enzyme